MQGVVEADLGDRGAGIDDKSVRRNEAPRLCPKPGSSGPIAKRWWNWSGSPIGSTVGRWMMSIWLMGSCVDWRAGYLE